MPTRGPALRQVQRPIHTTRGVRRQAGTRTAYVSTTVLKRGRNLTPAEAMWVPLDTIHIRDVVIDGHVIGQVAAHSPSPHNAARPTRYTFRSIDGQVTIEDTFLDGLRGQIDRYAYPEGAELPRLDGVG